jgi:transposase-like protein
MNKAKTLIVGLLVALVLSALSIGAVYAQNEGKPEREADWIAVAASAIGIEETALRDALAEGQTIAEVAEENGVDPQAVIDAIVATETENLSEQITDLVQGQAERPRFRFGFIPMPSIPGDGRFQFFQPGRGGRFFGPSGHDRSGERMPFFEERGFGFAPFGEGFPFFEWQGFMSPMTGSLLFTSGHALLESAAEAIQIEPEALQEALADGQTIAEIAEEHDVDPQTVTDAILACANARLDEALADGWLTEDQIGRAQEAHPTMPERRADRSGFCAD